MKSLGPEVALEWEDVHPVSTFGRTSDFDQRGSAKMLKDSQQHGSNSLGMLYGYRIANHVVKNEQTGINVVLLECGVEPLLPTPGYH